jgi:hypothetical protein
VQYQRVFFLNIRTREIYILYLERKNLDNISFAKYEDEITICFEDKDKTVFNKIVGVQKEKKKRD